MKISFMDFFFFFILNILAQNKHCGYTLEPVLMSIHNVCFGSKIKKLGILLQTPVFSI